jgi:hypothetical protein
MYIYSNITARIYTLAIYYSLIRLYIVIEESVVRHQSMYAKYICNSNIQQYLVNSLYRLIEEGQMEGARRGRRNNKKKYHF